MTGTHVQRTFKIQSLTYFVHKFATQLLQEFNVITIGFPQYNLHIHVVSKLELYDDEDINGEVHKESLSSSLKRELVYLSPKCSAL